MESLKEKYDYYARCVDDANVLLGAIEHLEETPIVKAIRRVLKFEEIEVAEENMERLRYGIEHGREHERDFRDGDFIADEHSIMLFKEFGGDEFTDYPVVYAAYNRKNDNIFAIRESLKCYHGLGLDFATNVERTTLLNKLKERGYEWNPDKLELIEIDNNNNNNKNNG